MAKVKTAVATIKAHLKAKGLDAAEIKEVFDELEAADQDLDTLAQAISDNNKWQSWYKDIVPQVEEVLTERETLKQQLAKLEAAGFKFENGNPNPQAATNTQQAAAGSFDPKAFEGNLVRATSDVMKNVAVYGLRHFKKYGEEPDYNAIEKIMGEKGLPFDVAYGMWEEPKRKAAEAEDVKKQIEKGIKEGLQAERTRMGIPRTRKKADDIDVAPISDIMKSKKDEGPTDRELREAFTRDLDEAADAVTH